MANVFAIDNNYFFGVTRRPSQIADQLLQVRRNEDIWPYCSTISVAPSVIVVSPPNVFVCLLSISFSFCDEGILHSICLECDTLAHTRPNDNLGRAFLRSHFKAPSNTLHWCVVMYEHLCSSLLRQQRAKHGTVVSGSAGVGATAGSHVQSRRRGADHNAVW